MKQPVGFRSDEETAAVFARVPVEDAERLERASAQLRRPKREILSALLSALDTEHGRLTLGRAWVEPSSSGAELPEVLTVEQLANLLQVDPETVRELARRGELPGRKLGRHWRFSRRAVLDWLSGPSPD